MNQYIDSDSWLSRADDLGIRLGSSEYPGYLEEGIELAKACDDHIGQRKLRLRLCLANAMIEDNERLLENYRFVDVEDDDRTSFVTEFTAIAVLAGDVEKALKVLQSGFHQPDEQRYSIKEVEEYKSRRILAIHIAAKHARHLLIEEIDRFMQAIQLGANFYSYDIAELRGVIEEAISSEEDPSFEHFGLLNFLGNMN